MHAFKNNFERARLKVTVQGGEAKRRPDNFRLGRRLPVRTERQ